MSERTTSFTAHSLAHALYSPMFAERDTIKEAYAYAQMVARASGNPPAVITAMHVMMNTIAKEIEKLDTKEA